MPSFRQQMQELADKIARSRSERHQAVAQLPKANEQLRRQVGRFREETRRELHRTSNTLARELGNFATNNSRNVKRLLRDTRSSRLSKAQALRSRLNREVTKNRNDIVRMIQQNHAQRQRMQRSQNRQSVTAIANIHQRVVTLRGGTQRLVRNLATDRSEARKIWNNLRRPRVSQFANSAINAKAAIVAPAPTCLNLPLGELSGLAMPPTRV